MIFDIYVTLVAGIWDDIVHNKAFANSNNSEDVLRDITDGLCYRELLREGAFLADPNNISATFNTDGVSLFASTKVELWPIFLALNELSPSKRFARENMVLVGIWQGKGKPPFQPYTQIFSEIMNTLSSEGFDVHVNGKCMRCRLMLTCCIADLPAKAALLNMSYFNGAHACISCEEPGVVVKQGKGHSRSYPFRMDPPSMREHEKVVSHMEQATPTKRVQGFRGKSGLCELNSFDFVQNTVPDYMHCVLLGITKNLLHKWFSPTEAGKRYAIGKHLKQISKRLQKIRPPQFIERLPRDIEKHYSNYKATELQAWLLFYCLPCVEGILPVKYQNHFSLLSEATFVLLGDNIMPQGLDRAEYLLKEFYHQYSDLYGDGSCGLNVHNAGFHLVQYVKLWGPIWAWSCFAFEDCNAMLLDSVHGTGQVTKQILKKKHAEVSLRTLGAIQRNKACTPTRKGVETRHCTINGALKGIQCDGNIPHQLFSQVGITTYDSLYKAKRIQQGGEMFYSSEYSRMHRRICNCVLLCNDQCALVNYFVFNSDTNEVYAIITPLEQQLDSNLKCLDGGKHLIPVVKSHVQGIVPVQNLLETLIYVTGDGDQAFVARAPNQHGRCVFK